MLNKALNKRNNGQDCFGGILVKKARLMQESSLAMTLLIFR